MLSFHLRVDQSSGSQLGRPLRLGYPFRASPSALDTSPARANEEHADFRSWESISRPTRTSSMLTAPTAPVPVRPPLLPFLAPLTLAPSQWQPRLSSDPSLELRFPCGLTTTVRHLDSLLSHSLTSSQTHASGTPGLDLSSLSSRWRCARSLSRSTGMESALGACQVGLREEGGGGAVD